MERNYNIEAAVELLGSLRGRMLVGDALRIAIKELNKIEGAKRPVSNIDDMEFLLENFALNIPRSNY